MLDLNDFYYFVHVVDRGGITAASRSLSVPKSTVSFRIQQLESALGARLLNRTSRQFSVTDAGMDFYKHAAVMLREAQAAEALVRQRVIEPVGNIRITTAFATAQFATGKIIPGFLRKYPKVNIVQHVTDTSIDLVAENFDLAIRAHSGNLPDSDLVKRTLGEAPWRLFAASKYLDPIRPLEAPSQLAEHSALFMPRAGAQPTWHLKHTSGREEQIMLRPRFTTDDLVGLKAAALDGLGIVALPAYTCKEDIDRGTLRTVLPEWSAGESTLTALFPNRLGILPSVRVFTEYLANAIPSIIGL